MAMDWIQAFGQQDDSFASMLAQRDLTKKLALLEQVAQTKLRNEQAEKDRLEQSEYRKAVQEQTKAERDRMAREREVDNERARFTAVTGRMKPGDRVVDPSVRDLISKYMGNDQLTPDEKDPNAHIFRKHEFEQAEQKFRQQEEIRAAEEKRQQRELELREKADKRAEKDAQLRQTREERIRKAAEAKQKQAEAVIKDIPTSLRAGVKARAEAIIQEKSSVWDFLPWADQAISEADAWIQAAEEVKKKAQESGLMPITPTLTPPPNSMGRGGGAGSETDAQRAARLKQLHGGG